MRAPTIAHAVAYLEACHAAFVAHAYARTPKHTVRFLAEQLACARTLTDDAHAADVLRIAAVAAEATKVAHRVAYVEPEAAPAPVAAPAPEAAPVAAPVDTVEPEAAPEFFRLLDRATVFRVESRYLAAEVIPSVRGITLDGASFTCARVVDVEPCTVDGSPIAPAPVDPEPEAAEADGCGLPEAPETIAAACRAGWRFDQYAADAGDWPWFRTVESDQDGPFDSRAIWHAGTLSWRLYVETAAEALAEFDYAEPEAAPPAPAPSTRLPVARAILAAEAAARMVPVPCQVQQAEAAPGPFPFGPALPLPAPAPRPAADVLAAILRETGPAVTFTPPDFEGGAWALPAPNLAERLAESRFAPLLISALAGLTAAALTFAATL